MKMKRIGKYKVTLTNRSQFGYVTILPDNLQVEFKNNDAIKIYAMLKDENEIEEFIRFYLKKYKPIGN